MPCPFLKSFFPAPGPNRTSFSREREASADFALAAIPALAPGSRLNQTLESGECFPGRLAGARTVDKKPVLPAVRFLYPPANTLLDATGGSPQNQGRCS